MDGKKKKGKKKKEKKKRQTDNRGFRNELHVFPTQREIRKYCMRERERERMVNLPDSDIFRALFSRMDGSILQGRDGHVRLAAGGLHIIAFFLPFSVPFSFLSSSRPLAAVVGPIVFQ